MKDFLLTPLVVAAFLIQIMVHIIVVPIGVLCILAMTIGDKIKKMWRNN